MTMKSFSIRQVALIVVLVALVFGASGFMLARYLAAQETAIREAKILKAVSFLVDKQFNPGLNLTREGTSGGRETTYWLLSDNLLASKALWSYNASVSARIRNAMVRYGYVNNQLHESLFGLGIPIPPRTGTEFVVKVTTQYTIKVELHNGTQVYPDYQQYCDLLVYVALDSEWLGNRSAATNNFTLAIQMWDGKGIADKQFSVYNEYQSYKLALLLYASKILNVPLSHETEIRDRMWSMQRDDGGLWTGYRANLQSSSVDANTESTALAILAGA